MNHSVTRINYNRISRWYDWFTSSEKRFTETGLQALNILPGEKVLEIGFGTGRSLIALAKSVCDSGKVYGIDISDGMLRMANKKISRNGFSGKIILRLGDATNLPFEGTFFDAIFISFTLELFDSWEIPIVLRECNRVLVDHGRLCVVALKDQNNMAVNIYKWFHSRLPILVDCCPINLSNVIEAAGFLPVDLRGSSMWGLPVEIVIARKYG
jgi:ubiquinone/menaquinone biosynthesis C-methylase UbiE